MPLDLSELVWSTPEGTGWAQNPPSVLPNLTVTGSVNIDAFLNPDPVPVVPAYVGILTGYSGVIGGTPSVSISALITYTFPAQAIDTISAVYEWVKPAFYNLTFPYFYGVSLYSNIVASLEGVEVVRSEQTFYGQSTPVPPNPIVGVKTNTVDVGGLGVDRITVAFSSNAAAPGVDPGQYNNYAGFGINLYAFNVDPAPVIDPVPPPEPVGSPNAVRIGINSGPNASRNCIW
jgi:hypothetical protein